MEDSQAQEIYDAVVKFLVNECDTHDVVYWEDLTQDDKENFIAKFTRILR